MVTSIARQSVIIKCNMKRAGLLGNYEFYYAAGLAAKLFGLEAAPDTKPAELAAFLQENLQTANGSSHTHEKNEQESYLLSILMEYTPEERYDDQMKELYLWGKEEQRLWQM